MKFSELHEPNKAALKTYCRIIINLRDLRSELAPDDYCEPVANHVIRKCIRYATDSVSKFPGSGKTNALFESHAARDQKISGYSNDLVCDHVIPVSVLTENIVSRWEKWSPEDLMDFLLEFGITCVITKREDDALADRGLLKKMPVGNQLLGADTDKFSRYREVGNMKWIEREPN